MNGLSVDRSLCSCWLSLLWITCAAHNITSIRRLMAFILKTATCKETFIHQTENQNDCTGVINVGIYIDNIDVFYMQAYTSWINCVRANLPSVKCNTSLNRNECHSSPSQITVSSKFLFLFTCYFLFLFSTLDIVWEAFAPLVFYIPPLPERSLPFLQPHDLSVNPCSHGN